MVGAAFVTILMIVGNTMVMAVRERTREIGVLKTLGFSGARVLRLVLGETMLLALLGGIPGLALAALATLGLRQSVANFVPGLTLQRQHHPGRPRHDGAAGPGHRARPGAQRVPAQDRRRAGAGLTMRSLLLQIVAVTRINLKSIPQRFWLSLSTVVAVALVVMVLLSFLAMANGFQQTLKGTGSDEVAVILRGGSQAELNSTVSREQVRLIEDGPGIARGADGKPMVSAELYLVVDGIKRSSQTKANMPLRGIGQEGAAIRKGITIIEGRMFAPGIERDRGRQGADERVPGLRARQHGAVRHRPLDRGRRVLGRRQRVRVGDLGRPAGGAEPVQPQQFLPDRAGAAAEPGEPRDAHGPMSTTIRA